MPNASGIILGIRGTSSAGCHSPRASPGLRTPFPLAVQPLGINQHQLHVVMPQERVTESAVTPSVEEKRREGMVEGVVGGVQGETHRDSCGLDDPLAG
jgi:hypothetical protein